MKIYFYSEENGINTNAEDEQFLLNSAICLGGFDGIHKGHKALFCVAKSFGKWGVLLFDRNIKGNENLTTQEEKVKLIEKSGGISHINHPTDLLQSWKRPECAKVPENIEFFADLLRRFKSCMGIEVLNMYDIPNRSDRILWD